MIRVLQLIFDPFDTWLKIAEAQRRPLFILIVFLLPLAVLCAGAESYAMTLWGERRGEFGGSVTVLPATALRYAAAQITLWLGTVFLGSWFLRSAAEGFNLRVTYTQTFTAMAYGIGPIVLLRLLHLLPPIPTWLCWAVGAVLSVSVLYHGVALILKPEQTKGFGLYLVAALITLLFTGMSHMAALAVLQGTILR